MTAVACGAAASLLPTLEPLLGASIALNLAYLNLAKFGYISVVKSSIGERLKRLDPSVKTRIQETPWFTQMVALAGVDTLDQSLPSRDKLWVDAPGLWGILYNILFYWRVGRGLSILATIHALFLLILGVGHSSQVTTLWKCAFVDGHLGNDFLFASLGLLWPILVVGVGTIVCSSAAKFVKYQTKNLAEEARRDASTALSESQQAVARADARGRSSAVKEPKASAQRRRESKES